MGLAFVAETRLSMMTAAGLSPRIAQWVAGMDLLTREQYLDYARLRRFRQSIVGRADAPVTTHATRGAGAPDARRGVDGAGALGRRGQGLRR